MQTVGRKGGQGSPTVGYASGTGTGKEKGWIGVVGHERERKALSGCRAAPMRLHVALSSSAGWEQERFGGCGWSVAGWHSPLGLEKGIALASLCAHQGLISGMPYRPISSRSACGDWTATWGARYPPGQHSRDRYCRIFPLCLGFPAGRLWEIIISFFNNTNTYLFVYT